MPQVHTFSNVDCIAGPGKPYFLLSTEVLQASIDKNCEVCSLYNSNAEGSFVTKLVVSSVV